MNARNEVEEDFFLPDLCQAQSILFLVLVAELLVLVLVLASSSLLSFSWSKMGLTSLFVQWVVLTSATVLCNFRPLLMRMSIFYATLTGYGIILSLTLIFSILGEWITMLPDMPWNLEQTGNVSRNLIVAASQGKGADIYNAHCAACHQLQGGGVPGEIPPLSNSDWVSGDKGRLIATVLHGVDGPLEISGEMYDELMPGFAFLDDTDTAALLTFIRSSFGNSGTPVHESEVLLVRSSEDRESPWDALKLKNRTGLVAR